MRTFNGPIPERVASLPRDRRGFPVPFFVAWEDGVPSFPVLDPAKLATCLRHSRCWICGQTLGSFKCFVIGPMCVVNRISAEPPSHRDCAEFAVRNCPFMAHPLARRAETQEGWRDPGGVMIERNPGVSAIWVAKGFTVERHAGKPLFRLSVEPHDVTFWAKGRRASRAEVDEAIRTGLPLLETVARAEGALSMLYRQLTKAKALIARHLPDLPELPDPMPDVDLSSFAEQPA